MIYKYRDTKVFYKFYNRNKQITNVFLHGWGCEHKDFLFCKERLSGNALYIDFPPFGQSDKKLKGWTIFTYANMVISLCHHLKIGKANLIGHSFGGRVAILVSALCKEQTNKLVLVDSAGIKPRRKLSFYIKILIFKIRRKLGFDVSKYGSCDYLALSKEMKLVFNNIVNTHLDDFLSMIKCETLIMFGKKDKITPLYMAKKINKKISNSKLIILEDAGHFCYLDRKLEFLKNLENFLKK